VHSAASARVRRRPPGRADRAGGGVVGDAAAEESVTLAGRVDRARAARGFVAAVLGDGHPCRDVAVLLASELFGNSVRHSASALPGETVTVAVSVLRGVIRVEVTDRGGPGTRSRAPRARTPRAAEVSLWSRSCPRGGGGGGAAGRR
jgi:anti-sigma regulatory factor (Ser/Thr protein kinase)